MHGLGCLLHSLVADSVVAKADVAGDVTGEQMDVLQDEGKLRSERGEIEVADVHAVDRDAPFLHIVEPQQQVDDVMAGIGFVRRTEWSTE